MNASPSMRSLGDLLEGPDSNYIIEPDAGSDLDGIARGPYPAMKAAMDAIAAHLGGECSFVQRRRF